MAALHENGLNGILADDMVSDHLSADFVAGYGKDDLGDRFLGLLVRK